MDDDAFSRVHKMPAKAILDNPKTTVISIINLEQIRKNVIALSWIPMLIF